MDEHRIAMLSVDTAEIFPSFENSDSCLVWNNVQPKKQFPLRREIFQHFLNTMSKKEKLLPISQRMKHCQTLPVVPARCNATSSDCFSTSFDQPIMNTKNHHQHSSTTNHSPSSNCFAKSNKIRKCQRQWHWGRGIEIIAGQCQNQTQIFSLHLTKIRRKEIALWFDPVSQWFIIQEYPRSVEMLYCTNVQSEALRMDGRYMPPRVMLPK